LSAGGEEYGEERLLASVRSHRQLNPQAILDAVLNDVRAFCVGVNQSDDVTAMVLRYAS
jgi:serine phosphatase RsbU (regulator of sigma subunit)